MVFPTIEAASKNVGAVMLFRFVFYSVIATALIVGCAQRSLVPSETANHLSAFGDAQPMNLKLENVVYYYPLPQATTYSYYMATGGDKNAWFTEQPPRIGKINRSGVVKEFNIPSGIPAIGHISADATGSLWFTGGLGIGKVATTGVITEYALPPGGFGYGITLGPDGNMWFTDYGNNAIGFITSTGSITEYPLPTPNTFPRDIVAGPDGNMWFIEYYTGSVGRSSLTGNITEFAGAGDAPFAITAGADGNLYASAQRGIWRISTSGSVTEYQTTGNAQIWGYIIVGPDKQLWMTSEANGAVIEFDPKSSKFSSYIQPNGSGDGSIRGLTVGGDGDIWIAGGNKSNILVYEENVKLIGIRLNGEMSIIDPNYGFELGYAVGNGTTTQTISLHPGDSVQFKDLDTIPHSAAFLGNATANNAPWPSSFNGSTTQSPSGTAIGTTGWATGSLNAGQKSPIYETGLPGFYMIGCQYHYNSDEMRTVVVVH